VQAIVFVIVAGILMVVAASLAFAWVMPVKRKHKIVAVTLVACGFLTPIVIAFVDGYRSEHQANINLERAEALFAERCKSAGEKIVRTDKDVEGIFLMKVRPLRKDAGGQYDMYDPYGDDVWGDGYIENFLRGARIPRPNAPYRYGYQFVEAIDPKDGIRYRYIGAMKVVGRQDETAPNVRASMAKDPNHDLNIYAFGFDRVPAQGDAPRYGITYDDISTKEDRDHWIAGSSLKIVDLRSGEIIGERIGYMMDPGQGSRAGGRQPWLYAADRACPPFLARFEKVVIQVPGHSAQTGQSYDFAEKIVAPRVER